MVEHKHEAAQPHTHDEHSHKPEDKGAAKGSGGNPHDPTALASCAASLLGGYLAQPLMPNVSDALLAKRAVELAAAVMDAAQALVDAQAEAVKQQAEAAKAAETAKADAAKAEKKPAA